MIEPQLLKTSKSNHVHLLDLYMDLGRWTPPRLHCMHCVPKVSRLRYQ